MHERNPTPAGPRPRRFIDQTIAFPPAALERTVEIGDAVADVVNSGAAPSEESGNGAVGVARREQLDLGFTEGEREDVGAVGHLGGMRMQAEHVPVERSGGVEVGNRNSDVGNTRGVSHTSS